MAPVPVPTKPPTRREKGSQLPMKTLDERADDGKARVGVVVPIRFGFAMSQCVGYRLASVTRLDVWRYQRRVSRGNQSTRGR